MKTYKILDLISKSLETQMELLKMIGKMNGLI